MGAKVLTVDDSKTIRLIITKALKPFDCEVMEAANGVEGLAMANREKPDVILLYLTMPVMDGYETLSKQYEDAKDWRFSPSFGEVLASFGGKELVNA